MAEETPMSPISEAVPPKANPLATPATAHAATLKLKPVIRRPATVGATQTALKPGLKLPTKPGIPTAGLKLPPKPGATQTALKPGLKLPSRPVIRKPGAAAAPTVTPVVPKTVAGQPATQTAAPAPVAEMTPVAELPKVETPKPLDALKAVTQNLKSITAPIPQQAVLRKTGIIADSEMTAAQKQAAKSKTARISLSDAMGVAPVKNEALPMKTIRIKRPVDIAGATSPAVSAAPAGANTVTANPSDTQTGTKTATAPSAATSFTQRKTLKISRPGGTTVRPTGKFGVKKPTAAPAPAEGAAEVADIPDMPSAPVAPVPLATKDLVPDVPKGVAVTGLIVQIAACLAMAFLGWLLIENAQLPLYAGGLGM